MNAFVHSMISSVTSDGVSTLRPSAVAMALGLVIWLAIPSVAKAEYGGTTPNSDIDPKTFQINEKKVLGVKLDATTPLIDDRGTPFTLGEKFGKPLILVLSYYTCDGSCSVINQDLYSLLKDVRGLTIGQDYHVLTVSFDSHDTLKTLGAFKNHLGLNGALGRGWTFATFRNAADITPFAKKIGYKFFWSPRDATFFHPGAFLFITPDGRLSRVLYALNSSPGDVKLAILDSKQGKFTPREIINFAISLCYSYNYSQGSYTLNIPLFVGAGSLTLGISAFTISVLVFRRRKMREAQL